jgi:hypothetical protein
VVEPSRNPSAIEAVIPNLFEDLVFDEAVIGGRRSGVGGIKIRSDAASGRK